MSELTLSTPYGVLDRAAVEGAEQAFDTRSLLRMVEELDRITGAMRQEAGLRDDLLRLHAMAHTVINGARVSVPVGESLPDLATDVLSQVQEMIEVLQRWIAPLELLQNLGPRD